MSSRGFLIALAVAWCAIVAPVAVARSDDVLVAVATNFAPVARQLGVEFERSTGHELRLISGSTGKLYAQIVNGAPFEVLLAADRQRPARLVSEGLAVATSRRTYAVGRLVLWSPDPQRVARDGRETLREADFRWLALANPDLAPYGVAAREVLMSLGLEGVLADRLVIGENIGQTHALVATGNAEIGLIAASQRPNGGLLPGSSGSGSRWLVPRDLHAPIRQDAVLLRRGSESAGARAFLDYLASPPAKELIRSFGYEVD